MTKMSIIYEGQLHCKLIHEQSGSVIYTDAPKDNNGKGEAFSPTDLAASALGACMMTVMGIQAARHNVELKGTRIDVIKEMVTEPSRRIGTIRVTLHMAHGIPVEKRSMLENAAHTCPVHKSLDPDVKTPIQFIYPD